MNGGFRTLGSPFTRPRVVLDVRDAWAQRGQSVRTLARPIGALSVSVLSDDGTRVLGELLLERNPGGDLIAFGRMRTPHGMRAVPADRMRLCVEAEHYQSEHLDDVGLDDGEGARLVELRPASSYPSFGLGPAPVRTDRRDGAKISLALVRGTLHTPPGIAPEEQVVTLRDPLGSGIVSTPRCRVGRDRQWVLPVEFRARDAAAGHVPTDIVVVPPHGAAMTIGALRVANGGADDDGVLALRPGVEIGLPSRALSGVVRRGAATVGGARVEAERIGSDVTDASGAFTLWIPDAETRKRCTLSVVKDDVHTTHAVSIPVRGRPAERIAIRLD